MAQYLKRILAITALLLCQSGQVYAGTLTSTVNRNQVGANETLTLEVNYDERVNSSELNYQALETDFDILGVTPQSSSVSIVNGQASRVESTVWTITLVPKRGGTLTIPSFSVNNDVSQAITITVDNSAQTSSSDQPLRAWVVASSDAIYPSQQLLVEIEISAQSNIGNLNGPQLVVKDAKVESLGQNNFQRVDNGVARQIVVLKYAVFAEQPGELIIPRMTFTAVKGGQRSVFGTRGQQVVAQTEQLSIKVKERPGNNTVPWFPAESVKIRSEWSNDTSKIKVGTPITRTITVTAQGQQAEIIPPLNRSGDIDGIKAYQDQPQLHTQATNDGFVGTRIESTAIVASKEGQLTLPELKLNWWNVKTQQLAQAVLPAETLMVSGVTATSTIEQTTNALPQAVSTTANNTGNKALTRTLIAALAALAFICLIQFWFILKLRKKPANSFEAENNNDQSEAKAWQQLQSALNTEDASSIRKALLVWGKTISPKQEPLSLQTLAVKADDQSLKNELRKLDEYLYKGGTVFDSTNLKAAIDELRRSNQRIAKSARKKSNQLKPLYAD